MKQCTAARFLLSSWLKRSAREPRPGPVACSGPVIVHQRLLVGLWGWLERDACGGPGVVEWPPLAALQGQGSSRCVGL